MNDYRIQYVLTMPKQKLEDASPFFGFTPGVLDCLAMTKHLLHLPQHAVQLAADRDSKIAMKISGVTYRILPVETEVLPYLPIRPETPFWCIASTTATQEVVAEFIKSLAHPVLHLSSVATNNAVRIADCEARHILAHCHKVLKYLETINCVEQTKFFRGLPTKHRQQPSRRLSLKRRHHFVTYPNENVLQSSGYTFSGDYPLRVSINNEPYIRAIINSANAVKRERKRVIKSCRIVWPPPINLILTCPAFYQHWYLGKLRPCPGMEIALKAIASYRRQKNYYLEGSRFDPKDLESEGFGIVVTAYRAEIEAYSRAVALKAANHFAPTLRLPPVINLIYEDLDNLARCSRGNSPHAQFKQEKLYKKITTALTDGVPKQFNSLIDSVGNKIKLIGNAPLEWLPVRGLPLMLRYEVSRIPSTPGNVLFTLAGMSSEMGVSASAFNEILIVRSFEPGDIAGEIMSGAIDIVRPKLTANSQIRISDVSTAEEFIEVVNAFEGMVMIFDGHGRACLNEVGAVVIGGKPVDLFQFRTRLRVPPIIILSSCDTHAIDGAHASVANTFLMLGATTVLGTLLPVSAADAAVFTSRLVLRISEYIPLVTRTFGRALRWTTVVTGMQRMVYVTEQVQRLFKARGYQMSAQQHWAIQSGANTLILREDPEWYEKTVAIIAAELKQSEAATYQELAKHQLVDVIKYIQLGNPDQILISD
jgi:hypothetical protein